MPERGFLVKRKIFRAAGLPAQRIQKARFKKEKYLTREEFRGILFKYAEKEEYPLSPQRRRRLLVKKRITASGSGRYGRSVDSLSIGTFFISQRRFRRGERRNTAFPVREDSRQECGR